MTEVVEGQVLAGKYRVERVLGIGGMGMVVAALHLQLEERVALKFMLPEAFANAEAIARFAREARAAAKIKSEHVARVTDVGVLETGAPYMVMEYLDGSDLSAWLKQYGRLNVEQSVEFVLQACEAIAEAHSLGIVHRDLKPANLFVVRRPGGGCSVKVLDFGISKITHSGSPDFGVTRSSATMGSPLYMSPELISDARSADFRCDIWALGVILYELLCGVTPFAADNLFNVMLRISAAPPTPVHTHTPYVPPGVEAVIMKCLEKDPNQRYANVAELAAALVDFAPARARVSLERISGVLGPDTPAATQTQVSEPPAANHSNANSNPSSASWGATSPSRSPKRRAIVGISFAALTLALLVAATWLSIRSRGQSASAVASSDTLAKGPLLTQGSGSAHAPLAVPNVSASPPSSASSALVASLAAAQPANSASTPPPPSAKLATPVPTAKNVPPQQPRSGSDVPAVAPRGVYDDRK